MIPIIIQNHHSKKIIMFAWGNIETLKKTSITGYSYFFSRKRKKIWIKGEKSSNFQIIKSIYIDCDFDCVLLNVIQLNKKCCHYNKNICFYNNYD
ncbi:phosphoribosyl-AMP cyclohydrolase [Candidatus Vidania fulgoroideorum]